MNLINILFSFFFFSLFGWILEVIYRSFSNRTFVNPGLLKGPYLILYGTGALILMGSVSIFHDYNLFIKIFVYFLLTTGLELVSAYNAEYFFQKRLWDYSDQRFQYKGHICAKFSIYWVFLAFAFEYIIYTPYLSLMNQVPAKIKIFLIGILIITVFIDFIFAVFPKKITKRI